jgi:O-antigen ligase
MAQSVTTPGRVQRSRRHRLLWSPVALFLVLLMAVGSIVMWVGLPLGLIWIASAITDSSQPSLGPYLLILVGLPVGMFAIGKLLGSLDRAHGRITGRLDDAPQRAAWLQSMRDERGPRRKRRSVLDTVMIVSVLAALVAGAIWFMAFAGSPLPS